jgi:hypothetical protein
MHLNQKSKLGLDLPFEAIPAAIILYSNIIPSIQSSLFIEIFIENDSQDIINLFESLFITINFRDRKTRVSFAEFDQLLHFFHIKFPTLIFETRNHILFCNTRLTNCSIFEVLYYGIEQTLQNFLITSQAVANLFPSTACQVRFSRGDAWMNEHFLQGGGIHLNTFQRSNS